ncbi:unnamed protein product [Orchesella dallaii]|uniref:T-cell immunomodulatory protein TIP C2 domain-containing protein n=1 Tax=Orchesella dallaii TaxID=48710 RepID=A0ABP1PQY5_9HEXA
MLSKRLQPKLLSPFAIFALFAVTFSNIWVSANVNMFNEEQDQFAGVDSTFAVFENDNAEVFPVSYFDVNADKRTDLLAVSKDRTSITIFLAFDNPPFLRRSLSSQNIVEKHGDKRIISVRPGDFTGDGLVDLMVTLGKDKFNFTEFEHGVSTSVDIIFCTLIFGRDFPDGLRLQCPGGGEGNLLPNLVQEPTTLDLNGDMVLDLVGEVWTPPPSGRQGPYKKLRKVWLSEAMGEVFEWKKETFDVTDQFKNETLHDMLNVSSTAYADLDANDVPELLVLTQFQDPSGSKIHPNPVPTPTYFIETYEIIKDENNQLKFQFTKRPKEITTASKTNVLGQPIVMDLEHNGKLAHLIPYCHDRTCDNFGIYVLNQEKAVPLPLTAFVYDGVPWSFIPPQAPPPQNHTDNQPFSVEAFYSRALTLLVGDYNLDGYPDLLGVLKQQGDDKGTTRAVIFENVPCSATPERPCYSTRTFSANFDIFKDYKNVVSASFYDIEENGVLDFILVHQRQEEKVAPQIQEFVIKAFQNEMSFDSSFLKVMVLTGQKCEQCKSGIPYGNVLPGATVKYSSENSHGILEHGVVVQTYRTAHLALDLPCEIFGIGHSPNFIETLSVSVAPNAYEKYSREWLQIIPNSQVVVVPNPVDRPNSWTMKLFLTPSDAVLQTFGVLVGICALFATLVAGLELKERREDRIARQHEAHRLVMY